MRAVCEEVCGPELGDLLNAASATALIGLTTLAVSRRLPGRSVVLVRRRVVGGGENRVQQAGKSVVEVVSSQREDALVAAHSGKQDTGFA